jgi:hypothetical protein
MQLYIPELDLIYVPIACNADTLLTSAVLKRWPEHQVVSHLFPGKRAVMWRSPHDRFEAAYWIRKKSGIEEDFDRWAFDVLTTGLRDTIMKPQLDYCDDPVYFFRWDFDGFRRLFKMKEILPPNDLDDTIFWSPRTRMYFQDIYRFDLRIWGGPYAPKFKEPEVPEIEADLSISKIDGDTDATDQTQEA